MAPACIITDRKRNVQRRALPKKQESGSMYTTDMYEGMLAETVTLTGANGETINAYYARPPGPGPYPGMVLAHHMPGSPRVCDHLAQPLFPRRSRIP
jgi:dipeptidyl aminopeptidase/acylaminoacyl peptidase